MKSFSKFLFPLFQGNETDTFYSTGIVSSCQMSATVQMSPKDDPLDTQYESQIFNGGVDDDDGQDLDAIIAQRIKAMLFIDSQYELESEMDLGVERLEIAPLTENYFEVDPRTNI